MGKERKHYQPYIDSEKEIREINAEYSAPFVKGQHCINDIVQQDLMYDDGIPCDPGIPEGITGLIRKYASAE